MCGLVSIVSKDKICLETLESMCESIKHRGPDDEGFMVSNHKADYSLSKCDFIESEYNIAFGHKRLAIQDLSESGRQPMCFQNRYWIIFNGEIYNFIELREDLVQLGYFFHSNSDTEVIMAAYDAWGPDCLRRFNGMWAFVIFDQLEQKLFISRDRFGVKPLYIYQDQNNFIAASEVKAILKYSDINTGPNIEYCKLYLKEGPKEYLKETAFNNIFRFPKASFVEMELADSFLPMNEVTYWQISPNLTLENYSESKAKSYALKYYELLKSAVELRLRADVDVATALSGGLDSSSISYLTNDVLKKTSIDTRQESFSSIYTAEETRYCDETYYINLVADHLDIKSNKIEPSVDEVVQFHKEFIYHLDTPASNTLMSNWYTYKLTKDLGFKVSLDGQGADEQLAGYLRYYTHLAFELPLFSTMKLWIDNFNRKGVSAHIIRGMLLKIGYVFGEQVFCRIFKYKNSEFLKRAFKKTNEVMSLDFQLNLEAFFNYADKGSMAFSIESRMPFMDYRLVEYLAAIPVTYKINGSWTKYLARIAFDEKLPDSITWREDKMGWPSPEEVWFKGKLKDEFLCTIRNSSFLNLFGLNFRGIGDEVFQRFDFNFLMRCYILALWYEIFFMGSKNKK